MEKSKKSGSKSNANPTTKQNSSNIQGVPKKEKFALWVYPETLKEVGYTYESDNCRSKSEFIEKAIQFYLGYLKQERNVNYLSPLITSSMEAVVYGSEQRLNHNLFKIAVELGKIAHTLDAANDVDEDTLRELHEMYAYRTSFDTEEVRHINGVINFERAVKFQNE